MKEGKILKTLAKHSSTILFGGSIILGAVAIVEAVRGTVKATRKVDEKIQSTATPVVEKTEGTDEDVSIVVKVDKLTKKEIVKTTWKCYIPTALCATGAAALAFIGHRRDLKALGTMTALVTMYEKKGKIQETALKKFKEANPEAGAALNDILNHEVIEMEPDDKSIVEETGHGTTLVKDAFLGRMFRCDKNWLQRSINEVNKLGIQEMRSISLAELYYELGLDAGEVHESIGWDILNGDTIDFTLDSDVSCDGEPVLIFKYDRPCLL